ncbi:hypothetical protein Lfu02_55120 [Longispora fulva]|uniref:Uncharacterized protein n=1 Tax=Longispora fulva TaxID=619741 RepID=A0A8J7KX88_9ACTN|nr:hypothetical protein [Longispora fulva]GIG61140.1 hypothetical protein Lfu02_55120 [Longispora fulva]
MMITVWSAYGHRFQSGDSGSETCMTCGGTWELSETTDPGDWNSHYYHASNGDDPDECTGNTSLAHGYERVCQNDNGRQCADDIENGTCEHTSHSCNCIQCG